MNNIYDDKDFFEAYANMARSKGGLAAAGEWHQLQLLIPDLTGARVLDLGCGYGWHSKYAADHGAASVVAIDLSEKMISHAKQNNSDDKITYKAMGLDLYEYPRNTFDFVISNLVLHYISDLDAIFKNVYDTLKKDGVFLFNIEHPIFTSGVNQQWALDKDGNIEAWPIDNYFYSGERKTVFLGQTVTKQHHTLTQIIMGLINAGFAIDAVEEARPSEEMLKNPEMKNEMRRPMMLLIKAIKISK